MNFYDHWILPPILDLVMRQRQLAKYRSEVLAKARGRVLEVGVGSGLNFPLYGKQVETVVGIDPSPRLLATARRRADAAGVHAEFLLGSATAIPLADNTIETVVITWTLCSILDPLVALREMRRVIKPDGKLLFVEHGLSPEPGIERWATQTYIRGGRSRLSPSQHWWRSCRWRAKRAPRSAAARRLASRTGNSSSPLRRGERA